MKWCLVPLLVLALALSLSPVTGCAPPRPAEQALVARGFDAAVVALVALDGAQASRLAAMLSPSVEEVQAEADRVRRLRRARDALEVARASFGRDGRSAREHARAAVTLLEAVADELTTSGAAVPIEARRGLALARAWLEGET